MPNLKSRLLLFVYVDDIIVTLIFLLKLLGISEKSLQHRSTGISIKPKDLIIGKWRSECKAFLKDYFGQRRF